MADYELIETHADLDALAQDLLGEKVISVDTEADSFYHYFDKTCLVQVGTTRGSWLIDPLEIGGRDSLAPLGDLFASPDVRVLFHAAEYDIFVLKRDYGFTFDNLFDTMVSSQLLGYRAVGLSALVEQHFDIKLPKDEQRSDWSRRPLTDKQLAYAASDVEYLIPLAEKLERELHKKKRLDWALEEFDALTKREWPKRSFDKLGYLRIKGARRLDPKSLSILRELYLLRDQRARETDRPPFKVLGNRTLIEIAEAKPRSLAALAEIKGVSDLILRRMGRELMDAVRTGRKEEHGPIPKQTTPGRRRMDRRSEKRLNALKGWRRSQAEAIDLDPGVLCPNATLETLALDPPASMDELTQRTGLKNWFVQSFGAEVVDYLNGAHSD